VHAWTSSIFDEAFRLISPDDALAVDDAAAALDVE
jgi:hypothetical protein